MAWQRANKLHQMFSAKNASHDATQCGKAVQVSIASKIPNAMFKSKQCLAMRQKT